jgi:uncharacterized protein
MEPIYIPHLLKAVGKKREIIIDYPIPDLDSLTPVRGKMQLRHGGTFLEVLAMAETIVTLTCDRCLKQYNYKLTIDTTELIWLEKENSLEKEYPPEREVALEDLAESLPVNGHFNPETWLYEQLCLAMPLRQVCSNDCHPPVADNQDAVDGHIDSCWSILEGLKEKLHSDN